MARNSIQSIEAQLSGLALQLGYEFVDAELVREGTNRYLRIYLDKNGGISLNDCETYHHAVIPLVDHIDYDYLEVCSPGLDRPLKKEQDYLKNIGSSVEIHLYRPLNGKKQIEGILSAFSEDSIVINTEAGEISFLRKDVALCKLRVDIADEEYLMEPDA